MFEASPHRGSVTTDVIPDVMKLRTWSKLPEPNTFGRLQPAYNPHTHPNPNPNPIKLILIILSQVNDGSIKKFGLGFPLTTIWNSCYIHIILLHISPQTAQLRGTLYD
jgi:hypothetical protein